MTHDAPLSVLIADDNRDAADTLAALLRIRGYAVQAVYSGSAAVEAALAHPPHLAVLDIGMPGLDGCAVARELRAHPTMGSTRLVALSAYSKAEIGPAVAAAGFDRHLVKGRDGPDGMEGVFEMLEEIKQLANETRGLLQDAKAEFAGAKDEIRETKEEVREVKVELREVKEELKEVKEELKDMRLETGT